MSATYRPSVCYFVCFVVQTEICRNWQRGCCVYKGKDLSGINVTFHQTGAVGVGGWGIIYYGGP